MKKIVKMLLLAAVFTLALSVSAFAAGSGTEAGICDVKIADGYESTVTVTPKTADSEAPVSKNETTGVYANTERVTVTFSGAETTKYYLVVALDEEGVPKDGNVAYINQETASSSSVSFNVYPKDLVSGQTYYIYISSNDGTNSYKKVASFSYYAPYKLGDVTGEGTINSADALEVLKHAAKLTELTGTKYLAANVQKDATLNSADAVKILKYAAKLITTWD